MRKGLSIALTILVSLFIIAFVATFIASFMSISKAGKAGKPNPEFASYEDNIVGTWKPIELATETLTFQYGICSQTRKGSKTTSQHPYEVRENKLLLFTEWHSVELSCIIKIYEDGGIMYMEISDVPGFAGKYKKE